jgi:hypothetical protein
MPIKLSTQLIQEEDFNNKLIKFIQKTIKFYSISLNVTGWGQE